MKRKGEAMKNNSCAVQVFRSVTQLNDIFPRDGERWTIDVCVLPEAILDLELRQKHREKDGRGSVVFCEAEECIRKEKRMFFLLNSDIVRDVSLEQK